MADQHHKKDHSLAQKICKHLKACRNDAILELYHDHHRFFLAFTRLRLFSPEHDQYDATSKIDPFKPLFISKSNKKEDKAAPAYVVDEHRDKGPLENFELSQLKLTGIVSASDRKMALVQEASGRGYVIHKGTRIGTKGGKVADILKDRVIVGEKMRDVKGNLFIRKTELKLNKKI